MRALLIAALIMSASASSADVIRYKANFSTADTKWSESEGPGYPGGPAPGYKGWLSIEWKVDTDQYGYEGPGSLGIVDDKILARGIGPVPQSMETADFLITPSGMGNTSIPFDGPFFGPWYETLLSASGNLSLPPTPKELLKAGLNLSGEIRPGDGVSDYYYFNATATSVTTAPVPLPASALLLLCGLAALVLPVVRRPT